MSAELTPWFPGRPPRRGWWDTKTRHHLFGREYEVRLWWTGQEWRASPHSRTSSVFAQRRHWRGLVEKPSE